MKKIILLCSLTILSQVSLVAADNMDPNRQCDYEVRVKSNSASLGSIVIDGGNIIANASYDTNGITLLPTGRALTNKEQRKSRELAAKTAKKCLLDAVNSSGKPESCKTQEFIGLGQGGAMKVYSIKNLKRIAQNNVCRRAANNGTGNTLRDYEIYAYNTTSTRNSDRRRQCQFPGRKSYLTLFKGTNLQCENGHVKAIAEKRFSGYYDKSATQVRKVIKEHCFNNNNAGYTIEHFEIQRNTGKIRAMFSCQ